MHAVATVGERGALTGIERVGADGVGRVELDHGRRTGRCRDIGALVATGILVAGAVKRGAVAGRADQGAPLCRLDGGTIVDMVLGDAGIVVLVAPTGCRGIQSARRRCDTGQTDGRPAGIELARGGIHAGMRRQAAARVLRIAAALTGIRRIRDQ